MNERLFELTRIADTALYEVETRYGSGLPALVPSQEGTSLSFHNRRHSELVRSRSQYLAQAAGCEAEDIALVGAAAAAHDVIQGKDRGVMEAESAAWFAEQLRRTRRFTAAATQAGELAILGTEPIFTADGLEQVATRQAYPTKKAELLAYCVASADLGDLYTAAGPLVGHDWYKELQDVDPWHEPSLEALPAFQREQLTMLERYHYPLPMAEKLLGGLRGEAIDHAATLLRGLERGEITTWQQVVAADQAFYVRHAA